MSLKDLDRKPVMYRCDKWDRDVEFRPISAHDLAALQTDFATINGTDATNLEAMTFYAELLAMTVSDPVATKDEWLHDITAGTLMELGRKALEVNGLGVVVAKKN